MAPVFTLVVAILSIESSYARNLEQPAQSVPDTVQFWFAPDSQWRVRTYALDHDIHVHSMPGKRLDTDWARSHIERHYSDVHPRIIVLSFRDPHDSKEVQSLLSQHGLTGKLEVAPQGFAFYNPDGATYRTESEP
jgi:uncharacterized protein YndB with AHSA1/START domain